MKCFFFYSTGTRVDRRQSQCAHLNLHANSACNGPRRVYCTPPRGAPEIPPRGHARLDHPPLWRRPRRQASAWSLVPAPPPSRQHPSGNPCTQEPLGSSAAGPHIPMAGTTGVFFSPQAPSGLGDDRAPTRLHSWCARRPPEATGATLDYLSKC